MEEKTGINPDTVREIARLFSKTNKGLIFSKVNVFVTTIIFGLIFGCFISIILLTLLLTKFKFCKIKCINIYPIYLFF